MRKWSNSWASWNALRSNPYPILLLCKQTLYHMHSLLLLLLYTYKHVLCIWRNQCVYVSRLSCILIIIFLITHQSNSKRYFTYNLNRISYFNNYMIFIIAQIYKLKITKIILVKKLMSQFIFFSVSNYQKSLVNTVVITMWELLSCHDPICQID